MTYNQYDANKFNVLEKYLNELINYLIDLYYSCEDSSLKLKYANDIFSIQNVLKMAHFYSL